MKLVPMLAALSFALVTYAPLRAQDAPVDPWSLIPADARMVLWCDGPAKLREAFADTRLAHALAAPELQSKWAPLWESLRAKIDTGLAGTGLDGRAFEEMVAGYSGRVLLGGGFDAEAMLRAQERGEEGPPPGMWGVMVLCADGHTDLARLAEMCTELREKNGSGADTLTDLQVGDRVLRAIESDSMGMTLPFMVGSHFVVIMSYAGLQSRLEKCLLPTGATFADHEVARATSSAGGWMDLRPFLALFESGMVQMLRDRGHDDDDLARSITDATGVLAIEGFSGSVEPAGDHTLWNAALELHEAPHGLLGLLTGPVKQDLASLDLVPLQRETWSIHTLDAQQLYAVVGALIDQNAEVSGTNRAQLEAVFAEQFHARLKEDLIDRLRDEIFAVGAAAPLPSEDEEDASAVGLDGICWGILIDDPQGLREAMEKVVRSRGLHVSRKREDYRGFTVDRFTFGSVKLHHAISDRAFLIAIGDAGAQSLRAVLDEEKDRGEGKSRAAFPDAVSERVDHAGSGWGAITVMSVTGYLDTLRSTLVPLLRQNMRGRGRGGEDAAESLDRLESGIGFASELLERFELQTVVSVSKPEPRRLQVQMIW